MVSRSEIEAALWKWSGWQADQRAVDELLTLVDQYAAHPAPCHVNDWQGRPVPVGADCQHAEPVQPGPWSFDDLPDAERERFLKLMKARETAAYQRGQDAALKDGAPRPVDGQSGGQTTDVIVEGYRDADGGLWVRVGAVRERMARASNKWKTCRTCAKDKPLSRFRRDASIKSADRNQLRAECKDCENEKRRNKRANKKQGT